MIYSDYEGEMSPDEFDKEAKKTKGILIQELEDARLELKQPPEWGNCIRGCEPAYLDREGFCSPACHVGAPRGKYVTVAA